MVSELNSESNHSVDALTSVSLRPSWGLLPEDVFQLLKVKYWRTPKKIKRLLSGDKPFPLKISLKPPTGHAAIQDINHFQCFVSSWKGFCQDYRALNSKKYALIWEKKNFRSLAEQDIPTHLIVQDVDALVGLLGPSEERQLQVWFSKIGYLFESLLSKPLLNHGNGLGGNGAPSLDQALFDVLIDHLEILDSFTQTDLELLVTLIPQLQQGIGEDCYLRALPVTFVDTKFIEKHLRIIECIVAVLVDTTVKELGLMRWLNCREKPKDWLLIKPLCESSTALLGGLPLLRLSSDTLQYFELPANNILVIENEQSCLSLNNIRDTIAVSGGGKNLSWMAADWLLDKNVAYWGDIDSEGLAILSHVRSKLSSIVPLMMDEQTVKAFAERMVPEPDSVFKDPVALTEKELALFRSLRAGQYFNKRLEQERLPVEYVTQHIDAWIDYTRRLSSSGSVG